MRPSRTFLRRMLDLLTATESVTTPRLHHHFRLNRSFQADLAWWRSYVASWNGVSILRLQQPSHEQCVVSDASGHWGCDAWYSQSWFQYRWGDLEQDLDISVKELTPIIIAAVTWGKAWRGQRISCYCNNQAVVSVLSSRSKKHLMHLLRCLFFIEARGHFQLSPKHISGVNNRAADDLPRDNLPAFFSKLPQASRVPSPTPAELPQLLLYFQIQIGSLCPGPRGSILF